MRGIRRTVRVLVEIAVWTFTLLIALVVGRAGFGKMDQSGGWADAFTGWGYPPSFRVAVGVVELLSAVSLLHPRTATYGAAGIVVVMIGAMGTHVIVEGRPRGVLNEVPALVLALTIGGYRWWQRSRAPARAAARASEAP